MINKNFSIRTDLAMEACELLNTEEDIIDGIKSKTKSDNDIEVTCVEIYLSLIHICAYGSVDITYKRYFRKAYSSAGNTPYRSNNIIFGSACIHISSL